jgi:hypothetical protein
MRKTSSVASRLLVLAVALLGVDACTDQQLPTDLEKATTPARSFAQAVVCRADVAAGFIACDVPAENPSPGLSLAVMLGGQGTYVQLASDNVSYDGSAVFQAEVTVQNLIAQSLGTTDGSTVDPDGIRVFFHTGPTVSGGTGTVSVANADGTATFTGSGQPYFQYDELLASGETSAAKVWQWSVPPSVTSFVFEVYVAAAVQHEDGWVTATPNAVAMLIGDTDELDATAWDALGREVEGAECTYTSTDPSVAIVDAGVVTAVANGTTGIIVTSPPRTPDTVAIAVIQTTTPDVGYWRSLTDFGALVFRVSESTGGGLGVYEKTYLFRDYTCGTGTWTIVEATSGAVGDYADGEVYFGLPHGDMIVYEPNGPHLEVNVVRGLFDASDHVLGNWTIESNGTICRGSWDGEVATALYLDYDDVNDVTFLTTERPAADNSALIASFAPGGVFEWKTELGGPIEDDVYDFVMVLAISEEEGPDGIFDVALVVDDGVDEQELANTTFQVPYNLYFRHYEDVLQGQTGGAAGDTLIVRVTFNGPVESGTGGLAFDHPGVAESHVLIDRNTSIVESVSPAAIAAAGSPGDTRLRRVEVAPDGELRWRQ